MHKPVLVTGASSGIGEACAVLLARKGFRVFAGARRMAKLKAIEGLGDGRITALLLDVRPKPLRATTRHISPLRVSSQPSSICA